jgi:DNA repair exonuclease SbcCD ATPase subunit
VECQKCAYVKNGYGKCKECAAQDALSLIKELTEENERLEKLCALRDQDNKDKQDLLYKAEAEKERLEAENELLLNIKNLNLDKIIAEATIGTIRDIDKMFERQVYDSRWVDDELKVVGFADIGYAIECWENYIKPELIKKFEGEKT